MIKYCVICKEPFRLTRHAQKTCSVKCRKVYRASSEELYRQKNAKEISARQALYRETHRELLKKRGRIWRRRNYAKIREYNISYRKANEEWHRSSCANYKARCREKERLRNAYHMLKLTEDLLEGSNP